MSAYDDYINQLESMNQALTVSNSIVREKSKSVRSYLINVAYATQINTKLQT